MNIDNHPMDIPLELLVHCLNFVPKLQACSQVNSSWRGAAIDVTAHRLNALAKGVYQQLSPSNRPNREFFVAILAKNGAAQSFDEIRVNDKEIKNLFLSHFKELSIEELTKAIQSIELLSNNHFSEELRLEGIVEGCCNELTAIDQIHNIGKVPRKAQVLFKGSDRFK